jgi:hypothetical protein
VTTQLFGWTGYHYFYWGRWVRGTMLAAFSILCILAGGWPILIPIAFGVFDGTRYLTMSDTEFATLLTRKGKTPPQA